MNASHQRRRNAGPGWGFGFLLWAERCWPRPVFRVALQAGVWVALVFMPEQRRHSRDFLTLVLGRPAGLCDQWRHFLAFTEFLMVELRAGEGAVIAAELAGENGDAFEALLASPQPALFGTFHFGWSDLLGYLLGARGKSVSLLRLRVGNSGDTDRLGARFAQNVTFLWVNDPANLLFELKSALESGQSLAMKCDRLEFSAKAEPFHFLGARRLFPFTIYHLAVIFARPVVFCVAIPGDAEDSLRVFSSPVFIPNAAASRAENLAVARDHFQATLSQLEALVRQHPLLWFNFLPLNPAVADAG